MLASLVVIAGQLDPVPVDAEIKAGYGAFFIFIGFFVAVGLLGWSLTRHLRAVESNNQAGLYGPPDEAAARRRAARGRVTELPVEQAEGPSGR